MRADIQHPDSVLSPIHPVDSPGARSVVFHVRNPHSHTVNFAALHLMSTKGRIIRALLSKELDGLPCLLFLVRLLTERLLGIISSSRRVRDFK